MVYMAQLVYPLVKIILFSIVYKLATYTIAMLNNQQVNPHSLDDFSGKHCDFP